MHATVRPCCHCERFVRYEDERCPFCAHPLEREAPPMIREFSRLSRAARVAASAALVAGCAASPAPVYGGPPSNQQPDPVAPVYGGPPDDETEPAPPDQTDPEATPESE